MYSHHADSCVKFTPVGKRVVVFSSLDVVSITEFAGSACICMYTRYKPQMVRHVARVDDVYFASGDLLRRDPFGFYFWVDRMGDTFRLVTAYCRPTSCEQLPNGVEARTLQALLRMITGKTRRSQLWMHRAPWLSAGFETTLLGIATEC